MFCFRTFSLILIWFFSDGFLCLHAVQLEKGVYKWIIGNRVCIPCYALSSEQSFVN
uniref:Uncharacterized protein n=1 Tax=Rhizophora mucronata TaxID=61149 RepID=A0A2P2J525_RHIMU